MLGKDFEPMFSVFEISDTQSCQRNMINVNGTRIFILTQEWGLRSTLDEGYFNF
jgi:hypothetical protein